MDTSYLREHKMAHGGVAGVPGDWTEANARALFRKVPGELRPRYPAGKGRVLMLTLQLSRKLLKELRITRGVEIILP